MSLINFNANNVAPQESFEPMPLGWYNGMIVESEEKGNSAGTGSYLNLAVRVIDGQYANRQVFDTLNLKHPNEVTVQIAEKQLSAYCHATGVMVLQDSQQLHGIPFAMRLGVQTDKNGVYEPRNVVKAVKPLGAGPGPSPVIGQAAPAAPPVGFNRPAAPVAQPPRAVAPQRPVAQPVAQPVQAAPVAAPQYEQPAVAQPVAPQPAPIASRPPWGGQRPA